MVRWKRDLILSIALIVISVVLYIYSGTFTTAAINIPAAMPDVYMRLWLGLMLILSVLLLIRTLRKKPQEQEPKMWGKLQVFTVIALFLYIFLLKWVGFRICTVVFVLAVTSVYCISGMEERPSGRALALCLGRCLVFALIVAGASDVLFRIVLSCNLPVFSLF